MKPSSDSAAAISRKSTVSEHKMTRSLLLQLTMIMPLSLAVIMMNLNLCSAVEHVVGDDRGWDPHSDFHGWASRKIFRVGDNLWFAYASGEQSVIELKSKEDFEACDISNPIRVYNGGVDSVPLVNEGTRYFSSRRVEDCQNGMKLLINVDAAPTSSESQTRSETDSGILGSLISRENLQKIGEWFLSWPRMEESSILKGGVKSVAEAPTSGSPPSFSTHSIFSTIFLSLLLFLLY